MAAEALGLLTLPYPLIHSPAALQCRAAVLCADAVPRAQDQIKETMLIAADIETFVKQTLGV